MQTAAQPQATKATTASTPSPTGAAPPPKPALLELWAHYRAVFQHGWAHRAELAGPAKSTQPAGR